MYHLFLGFLVLLLPLRACAGFASHEMEEVGMAMNGARQTTAARLRPECPRCHSGDTKFCYYNNYSLSQPRYHCRGCRRYWTQGGSLRDVPVGGGCRNRNKQQQQQQRSAASSSSSSSSAMVNLIPDMLPAFVPPPGWGSDLVLPPPAAAPSSFLDILRSGGGLLPIDAAMPLPAMASLGTGMQQHAMGDTTMVGLEWQPQLTGGINGGAGSSGVAQQHLGNSMTDDINGGQGSSRDDYYWYWIDDDNNGGPWQSLINNNNTSSLM